MLFLSADYYFPINATLSGPSFLFEGDPTIYWAGGGITLLVPFGLKHSEEVRGYFSQERTPFDNLGNVEHRNFKGCLFSCDSVPALQQTNSLFGSYYLIGGKAKYNFTVNGNFERYLTVKGIIGSGPVVTCRVGMAVRRVGDIYITATGILDDINNPLQKWVIKAIRVGERVGSQFYLSSEYTIKSNYFTSSCTPSEVISNYLSQIVLYFGSYIGTLVSLETKCLRGTTSPSVPTNLQPDTDRIFPVNSRNTDWPTLAARAYDSVPFATYNGIALISDLTALRSSVSTTASLIDRLTRSKVPLKTIANIFLAFFYGWRLLVLDLKSVKSSYNQIASLESRNQKCSAGATWISGDSHYTNYYSCYYERFGNLPSAIDQLISEFDLELNLGNIWDLIPNSFVADWFVRIGDLLNTVDSFYQIKQEHKIICTGQSIKCTRTMSSSQLSLNGWIGSIDYTYYFRRYGSGCIYPRYSITSPTTFNHFVEATALIVSKR